MSRQPQGQKSDVCGKFKTCLLTKGFLILENGDTPTGCVPDKKTISLLCILRKHTSYMHVAIKELFSDSQTSHFFVASPSVYVLRTRLKHLKGIETE